MNNKEAKKWLEGLLPAHYTCELRDWGVHCHSRVGICDDHMSNQKFNPEIDNHWMLIVKAIEQKFGDKLQEIFSQEPQFHSKFTVYLKQTES